MDLDTSGIKTASDIREIRDNLPKETVITCKLPKEQFDEIYNGIAALYSKIWQLNPDIQEKRLILEKITETGMWLKMAFEMEQPASEPQLKMEIKNVRTTDGAPQ